MTVLTKQQQIVQTYTDGFATGDVAQIVSCVSDDLVWEFNGQKAGEGKAAFEAQMRDDLSSGTAEVMIDRFVEQDDVVVALNRGRFVPHGGGAMPFISAEMYTFTATETSRIQTYQPMG